MTWLALWTLLFSIAFGQTPTEAPPDPAALEQIPERPLVVAVAPFEPLVFVGGSIDSTAKPSTGARGFEDDEPDVTGFSADLWRAVAGAEEQAYRFRVYDSVSAMLEAVERDEVDLALGGITITLDRERDVDFSLPTFRTGLDILVPAGDTGYHLSGLLQVLTPGRIGILVGFLLLIVVSGHLVWFAEQGDEAFSDSYWPGVVEGMYWAIVTASTVGYGDKAPVRWPGRAVAAIVIIISLPMFAIFTAELTSTFTVANLETGIEGPSDLRGERVAVIRGTASVRAVTDTGAVLVRFSSVDDAVDAVSSGQVAAFVFDAPNLQVVAKDQPDLRLVGTIFDPQQYGVAVATGSPLRERVNRGLLTIRERGDWERIRDDWFHEGLGE